MRIIFECREWFIPNELNSFWNGGYGIEVDTFANALKVNAHPGEKLNSSPCSKQLSNFK